MRYAFMSFSCPQLSLDELLAAARRYGYDGIEPRAGSGHGHGVELEAGVAQRRAIQARAAESGITLCCIATSCKYAEPATAAGQVDETRRYIDLAADVGSPRIRVFGGVLPEGIGRAEAGDRLVASLQAVAGHAAQRGVTVCVETHDDWSDPRHLVEVLSRVNDPAIRAVWDVMHPARSAGLSMEQAFRLLSPWIGHVHVHDGSARRDRLEFKAMGQGDFDHRPVLRLLRQHGYDAFLSGEWINWEPYETHLPRELAALKQMEEELS